MLEYYVLNWNFNKRKVETFNIFNNWVLEEAVIKEIKKYIRSPKKYKYIKQYANEFLNREEIALYGFEGFCESIRRAIAWQECGRCEYEIAVGDHFTAEISDILKDIDKYDNISDFKEYLTKLNNRTYRLEKWDCYDQCLNNIPMIAREIIYQYKNRKGDSNE